GVRARMQNAGQSCIAAKRFILHRDIAEDYIRKFSEHTAKLKVGNPMDPETDMGPLARTDLADQLEQQVNQSVEAGAKVVFGGNRKDNFYHPTLLRDVMPGMPAFDEELFGPVAAVTIAKNDEEALRLANTSTFGLGISVFTQSRKRAQAFIEGSEDGAVFINGLVKSDPRLPFGGTKRSGYGRELSSHGIREFVNVKTVWEGTELYRCTASLLHCLPSRTKRHVLAIDFGNAGKTGGQRDIRYEPLALSLYTECDIAARVRINTFNRLQIAQ